jgi:hypothetical protein
MWAFYWAISPEFSLELIMIAQSFNQFPTAVKVALKSATTAKDAERVLRDAGYKLIDGHANAQNNGYYAAREGGGYVKECVPCGHAVTVVAGCPGYHATVAVKG